MKIKTTISIKFEQSGVSKVTSVIGPFEIDEGPGVLEKMLKNIKAEALRASKATPEQSGEGK